MPTSETAFTPSAASLPITGMSSTSGGATSFTSESTRLARSPRRSRFVSARSTSPNGPSGFPALVS